MPLRKNVIEAPWSAATLRKRENSLLLSSPAPSQEKTTNCGGRSPGFSRSAFGCLGWAPVSAVEPSPISFGLGDLPLVSPSALLPTDQSFAEQAVSAPRPPSAPAVAVAVSRRLREMPVMMNPRSFSIRLPPVGGSFRSCDAPLCGVRQTV